MNLSPNTRYQAPGTRYQVRGLYPVLCSLCLCAFVTLTASATAVSGTTKLPDGTLVSGSVEFVLSQRATTTSPPTIFVPEKATCTVTSGAIGTCTVQGNDTLSPAGTFYRVTIRDNNNRVLGPTVNYTITGASVDLGTLPFSADATLAPPAGNVTDNLSVTGHLTVDGQSNLGLFADIDVTAAAGPRAGHLRLFGDSGDNRLHYKLSDNTDLKIPALDDANTWAAAQTFDTATAHKLNNIRKCDQFSGADAGEKIAACVADLPSTGGVADARGLEGSQTISSTATIPPDVTLLLGAATYTVAANAKAFLVNSRTRILGNSKGQSAGTRILCDGGIACIQSVNVHNRVDTRIRDVVIADITVDNAQVRPSGSIGIDMKNWDYSTVLRVSARQHEKGIRGSDRNAAGSGPLGGYYNSIYDSELASNTFNIDLEANAWRVIGGRVLSGATAGIRATNVSGGFFETTFEQNPIGVHLTGTTNGVSIYGSYFEGTTGDGAIVFHSGTFDNQEWGNKFSSAADRVWDKDGRNSSLSLGSRSSRSGSALSPGRNLHINGSFEYDDDADNIANGWRLNSSQPSGMSFALDSSQKKFGSVSQRWTIAAGGTSSRRLEAQDGIGTVGSITVEPNASYVITVWMRTDNTDDGTITFRLRIGESADTSALLNFSLTVDNQWILVRQPIVPSASEIFIFFDSNSFAASSNSLDRNLWIDGFKLERGRVPTEFDPNSPEDGQRFIPATTGQDLGSTSLRWDLLGQTGDFSGNVTIGEGTAITKVLSTTATINFARTSANTCSDSSAITLTGAADGDTVSVGVPNGSVPAGGTFFGWVSAANQVKVRFCADGTARDPASGTFRVTVVRF